MKPGIHPDYHPVWTGSRRHIDTAGQLEKFRRRYGSRA
jgi:large subunit ribosomal protein L31